MPKAHVRLSILAMLVVMLSPGPLFGQLGLGKKKNKDAQEAVSDQPPELSDSDKKKMAEIGQRPEVKDRIQTAWDEQRRNDLDFAYNVNSSVHFADISGPQFAAFRESYGQLYNNPILQQYLNNIGQHLVPRDSPNVYSFKLLLDPVPRAEALSTGTIYVSTGLVSMLDNEAQLAYVLGHEIGHVEKNHLYSRQRDAILEQELNKERERDTEKKRAIFSAIATGAGAAIGGVAGGGRGAVIGSLAGLGGGLVTSAFLFRSKMTFTDWSAVQENEADEAGLKYMLEQNNNYDVREVPRLYARLENMTTRDARVGLGFVGRLSRVKERSATAQSLLNGIYKATVDAKLKSPGLVGSTPQFALLMAALRRDNGIIALDYDLFAMARDNLEEAVGLRSNDARAQLYLGKVILLTSRTPEDKQNAATHFLKAIQYDEGRGAYPEPHLQHALELISQSSSADWAEVKKELQTYVALYQRQHAGALPNNMDILYDYFTLAGDSTWYVPPVAVVSTQNVEALRVNATGDVGAASAQQVSAAASGSGTVVPAVLKSPVPAKPKPKTVSAPH